MKTKPVEIEVKTTLRSILTAFCLSSQNIKKVQKLTGITNLWNGKRTTDQAVNILVRAIPDHKAKEIINAMPFPFIENYHEGESYAQSFFSAAIIQRRTIFWINEVLSEFKHIEIIEPINEATT